jgi:hypothetical protein
MTDAAVVAILDFGNLIDSIIDRFSSLADDGYLNFILRTTVPLERAFQDIDRHLMESITKMTECLKCIIPLPIDVPIYSVEDGISVDSVIARFGGVRGALDNSETLKLIAEAVGEFANDLS